METKTFRFVGEQLVYNRPHRFTVKLERQGAARYATFSTNGHEYDRIRITAAQWDAMVARHAGSQYVAKELRAA